MIVYRIIITNTLSNRMATDSEKEPCLFRRVVTEIVWSGRENDLVYRKHNLDYGMSSIKKLWRTNRSWYYAIRRRYKSHRKILGKRVISLTKEMYTVHSILKSMRKKVSRAEGVTKYIDMYIWKNARVVAKEFIENTEYMVFEMNDKLVEVENILHAANLKLGRVDGRLTEALTASGRFRDGWF